MIDIHILIDTAKKAREKAYTPYSNYQVGLLKVGKFFLDVILKIMELCLFVQKELLSAKPFLRVKKILNVF